MSKEPVEGNSMSTPAAVEDEREVLKQVDEPEAEAQGTDQFQFHEEGGCSWKAHQFYFVKFWPYQDPEKDSKLEWARRQCEQLDQEKKLVVDDKMEEIMSRGQDIYSQLERKRYRSAVLECGVEWKTMVVDFLQADIDKLNVTASTSSNQAGIHTNEEQLLTTITTGQQRKYITSGNLLDEINRAYFWYSQSDNREKFEQLLEDVKQIEERHEKAKADAASKGTIWDPLNSIKAIEEQIELLNKIPEELRPEHCEVMAEIKSLENELEDVRKDEGVVSEKFQGLIKRKSDLCEFVDSIRKDEAEANANYNEYLSLINNAKELARKKDVAALEELCRKQADKFMGQWNDSQAFRKAYEKALSWSLHYRELSRDGRTRNDEEEPIIGNEVIAKQFLHVTPSLLALFVVLDERNKIQC